MPRRVGLFGANIRPRREIGQSCQALIQLRRTPADYRLILKRYQNDTPYHLDAATGRAVPAEARKPPTAP